MRRSPTPPSRGTFLCRRLQSGVRRHCVRDEQQQRRGFVDIHGTVTGVNFEATGQSIDRGMIVRAGGAAHDVTQAPAFTGAGFNVQAGGQIDDVMMYGQNVSNAVAGAASDVTLGYGADLTISGVWPASTPKVTRSSPSLVTASWSVSSPSGLVRLSRTPRSDKARSSRSVRVPPSPARRCRVASSAITATPTTKARESPSWLERRRATSRLPIMRQ